MDFLDYSLRGLQTSFQNWGTDCSGARLCLLNDLLKDPQSPNNQKYLMTWGKA